jgi:hypothetical protein
VIKEPSLFPAVSFVSCRAILFLVIVIIVGRISRVLCVRIFARFVLDTARVTIFEVLSRVFNDFIHGVDVCLLGQVAPWTALGNR